MNLLKFIFLAGLCAFPAFGNNASAANSNSGTSAIAKSDSVNLPLKIKNIRLHQSSAPCKPRLNTYDDGISLKKAAMVVMECSIEDRNDKVKVTFSSDGKHVVRVLRTQYLKQDDPDSLDLIEIAIKFYGKPSQSDKMAAIANYGNAYLVTYSPKNYPIITKNKTGIGLLIRSYPCGDGSFGTEDCGGKGTRFIRYDLIDVSALEKAYEDGRQKYIKLNAEKLLKQKF